MDEENIHHKERYHKVSSNIYFFTLRDAKPFDTGCAFTPDNTYAKSFLYSCELRRMYLSGILISKQKLKCREKLWILYNET